MDIVKYIDSIELLCSELELSSKTNRFIIYSSVKHLVDEILLCADEYKKRGETFGRGNAGSYSNELLNHIKQLIGLEENSHPEEQQLRWIRTAIEKLRSVHCFDIKVSHK